jgi:hypothetical protein
MYALGRQLKMSRAAALAAGLIWALTPPAVGTLIEPMASATLPWFPLVLWGWDRACRDRANQGFVVAGIAMGLAVLGGHLQHLLWFGIFLVSYTVVLQWPDGPGDTRRRELARIGAGAALVMALAVSIGAIELLPTYRLFGDSIRVALAPHERLPTEHPSWADSARLVAGTIFTVEPPRFNLEYARVGLIPLALALLAVGRGRRHQNRLLLLACLFLLLAIGDAFPPSNWLLRELPGNLFRFAQRIGIVFTLAIAMLAGYGVETVLGEKRRPWRRLVVLAAFGLALGWPLALSSESLHRQQLAAGLGGLLLILLGVIANSDRWRRASVILAVIAMLAWSTRYRDPITSAPPTVDLGFRSATAVGEPFPALWMRELPKVDENGPTRLLCLACPRGNTVFLTGQQTPTGCVTLRPRRVDRLVYGRERVSDREEDKTLGQQQTLLDLLGVRHVVVRAPLADHFTPAQLEDSLAPLAARDGLLILENRTRLPRSFFISQADSVSTGEDAWKRITDPTFDPRRTVVLETGTDERTPLEPSVFAAGHVTLYQDDRVETVVDAPTRGFVVLLDRWAEGWHGEVNGRPAPILRANYLFRAVAVEAGRNVVRFGYHDAALVRGAWISSLSLIGALAVLLAGRLRRRDTLVNGGGAD